MEIREYGISTYAKPVSFYAKYTMSDGKLQGGGHFSVQQKSGALPQGAIARRKGFTSSDYLTTVYMKYL